MDLTNLTIKEINKLLKERKVSSVELTKAFLNRIKETNPKLNSFITVDEKNALAQASAADDRLAKKKSYGFFDGIPIAIKDNIATKDLLTTAGSKILESFIPPYDAFVVQKLKNAGTVILGKTNLDEFAMGSSTETSYFGPTKNPWNLTKVPGGSSGGSAVAVASGQTPLALGSDTGGSIRQPASFCGVVGLKPTYGKISRFGLIAMASSLDQIGTFTKKAADIPIILDLLSQEDERDSTLSGKLKVKSEKLKERNHKFKIGIPREYFGKGVDAKVEETVKKAILTLEKEGLSVEEISLPYTEYALACYYIIMPVEASSNLSRYDGIKYGLSRESETISTSALLDIYLESRARGFGPEAKRRIMLGSYASSAGYFDKYYLKAQKVRALIKREFDEAFKKVDCLITPTTPTVAFGLGEKMADPLSMYKADILTVPINIGGIPALSLPCGFSNNLPVGMQIIGPQFGEEKIIKIASLFEEITKDEPWRKLTPNV